MEEKKKKCANDIYFTREFVVENGVAFPVFYVLVDDIEEKPIVVIVAKSEKGLPEKLYIQSAHFSKGNKYYKCGAVYIDSYNKYYASAMSANREGELLDAINSNDKERIKELIRGDFYLP